MTRIGLTFLPIAAVFATRNYDLDTLSMLSLLVPMFVRGWGYDILEYNFNKELSIYIQLYIGTRLVECVEHTYESLYWWTAVYLVSCMFTLLKFNDLMRFYLDEFGPNTKKAKVASTFGFESNEKVARDNLVPVSVTNLVLLAAVLGGGTLLRIFVVYEDAFGGNFMDNLNLTAEFLGGALLVLIVVRSTALKLTTNVTLDYNSMFLLLLYVELTHVWQDGFWSQVVTVLEFALGVGVLALIHRQMARVPGSVVNSMLIGLKELAGLTWAMVTSQPGSMVVYVIASGVILSLLDDVQWVGHAKWPNQVTTITCPFEDFINGPVASLFDITNKDDAVKKLVILLDPIKIIRLLIRLIVIRFYPMIHMACYGPEAYVVGTDDPIMFLMVTAPLVPGIFILTSLFVEVQRVIRNKTFWLLAGVLSFASFALIQFTADVTASIWSILKGVEFEREYRAKGVYLIICQFVIVAVCLYQFWYRWKREPKENILSKAIDATEKLVRFLSSGGFIITAAGFVGFVFAMSTDFPIASWSIEPIIGRSVPDVFRSTDLESFSLSFTSPLDVIKDIFGTVVEALNPLYGITKVFGESRWCVDTMLFGEICILECIERAFGSLEAVMKQAIKYAVEPAVDLIKNQLIELSGQFLPVFAAVAAGFTQFAHVFDFLNAFNFSIDLFDGVWGMPFRLPWYITYGFIAVVVLMGVVSMAILVLRPQYFIQYFTNVILLVMFPIVLSILTWLIRAYFMLQIIGLGVTIQWSEVVYLHVTSIVVMVAGFIVTKYTGDDYLNEMKEEKMVPKYSKLPR